MRAWQVPELGEPRDVLTLAEVPDPVPGPGQVLVRVLGAAANFPDVLMCRGGYQVRPPLPYIPGIELCGEVVAAGPGVTGVAPGDRLIGGAIGGAFAELTLMNAATALPAPDGLDDAEAAAFFVTYQTGWFGLHRRARLAAGTFLILPHPEVHGYYQMRAGNPDRWLAGMNRMQQRIEKVERGMA